MIKYVYICSAGHSGSTLLDLLLGSHSKIESMGEISHLPKNIALNTLCSCGTTMSDCPAWQPIIQDLGNQLKTNLYQNPYKLNTGYPKAVTIVDHKQQTRLYLLKRKFVHGVVYLENRYGVNLLALFGRKFIQSLEHHFLLYDTVRKHRKVDIVIDSSKTYLEAIALYRKKPDAVRILVLSRDGRGVMYSNMKRNLGQRNGLIGWKHYYARTLPLLEKHVSPEHSLRVHYEDIAQKTGDELARICKFLGQEYEPAMLNFTAHEHHITNGNDMRFSDSSDIRLDTSWETGLTEEDRQYFEGVAGKLSRKLGYH